MKGAKELAESNKAFILRVRTAHAKLSGDKHELEHDDIDACPLWYDGCNCVKAVLSWLPGLADRLEHADNRLAALDSAVTGEVGEIAARCAAGIAGDNILQAIQDIKAVLTIVQHQATDIATANASILKLRAEVEEMREGKEAAEQELARIKGAELGEEIAAIAGRCADVAVESIATEEQEKAWQRSIFLAPKDRATLLDAVRVLTAELADLRRRPAESRALRLESELDTARAEAATLRESNRQLAENAQLATDSLLRRTQELAAAEEALRFKTAEADNLRKNRDALAHGEAEALKMMAAEKQRADRAEAALAVSDEVEDYPLGGN